MKRTVSSFSAGLLCLGAVTASAAVNVPDDYNTIQEAIDALEADPALGSKVLVSPGTYAETLTLRSNITVQGERLDRTILTGVQGETLVTADGVVGARLSNFILRRAARGILITNGADVEVTNNVFRELTTGVLVEVASPPEISNNVFYTNNTAVERASDSAVLRNNAFMNNKTAITPSTLVGNIANNLFFSNATDGPTGTVPVTGDPLFVDPAANDFHLRQGSPAIDAGTGTDVIDDTTADIGAYGGLNADPVPVRVEGIRITASTAPPDGSISLVWQANGSYLVTHDSEPGGYKVHYDSDRSGQPYEGSDATEGVSPIDVGDVTSTTLTGLSAAATAPAAPVLAEPVPLDGALELNWSAVAGANGYILHWGIASTDENTLDVGKVTSHRLTGLTNGTTYQIAVSAYSMVTYFLAVTAYDSTTSPNESDLSGEVRAQVGERLESLPSNIVSDFPEAIVPFPNLPDKGCFIATATYGSYSASQVRLFRRFRDEFLLTNAPGRAVVRWYYEHGRAGAEALQAHPEWKPVAQVALIPPLAAAWFAMETTPLVKLLTAVALLGWLLRRRSRQQADKAEKEGALC